MSEKHSTTNENLLIQLTSAQEKIARLEFQLRQFRSSSSNQHEPSQTKPASFLDDFGIPFQNIIDASPVPYALNDDEENIVYLNPAFTRTFGYDLSDIPTLDAWWPKAYPDEDYRNWVNTTWSHHLSNAIKSGDPFKPVELKVRCKDNSTRYIIASAASITDSYKNIHLVTLFDNTDRQVAQDELEITTSLLNNVINSTPDLIFVKNTQLQTILCNEACANAVGKSRDEMVGNTDIENGWDPELVMGNDKKGNKGFIHDDRVALSGKSILNSNDLANVNGEIRIFDTRKTPLKDSAGNIFGLLGVSRDITERQRAIDALHEANADFSATLKAIPDMLFELDEEGRYLNLWVSDLTLLAAQKKLLIGNLIDEVLPEHVAKEVHSALTEAAKSGYSQGQIIQLKKNQTIHWYELSTALKPSKTPLKHFIMLSRDITTRIETEQQLRHSQKMEALGKLTGGIAHDFNNMLGIMTGYAELLQEKITDNKNNLYVSNIIQAGERAKTLTSKLLDFSRKRTPNAQVTNINELILQNQHMLEKTLTAKITLKLDLFDQIWPVFVDPQMLTDAILNLSINAMHAMPDNGTLTFKTNNVNISQSDVTKLSLKVGEYAQLTISDSGCGMSPQVKELIFEPFFSTKGESGTGLGLSQVYGLMQQSEGSITVDSIENKGSTFTIYFPRHIKHQEPEQLDIKNTTDTENKGHETILIVDDEPALLELTKDILYAHGYNVFCAENGEAALKILHNETIDLVLTDMIMPKMDGNQLIIEMKKKHPHIKILIASGFNDHQPNDSINNDLFENQLRKPYKSRELLNKIRSLLDPRT
ncbi:MAG: PAS domain-containing protein [Gammaproteobacteria bacterium]|nr:PAS domain-containing protein [Gammaproteobacteria bacterium]